MQNKKMTIFGIGEKIAVVTLPWAILMIWSGYHWELSFTDSFSLPLIITGCLLIITGLIINFTSAIQMIKAFKDKKLLTTGFWGICRNPMYGSFVFFTIPGLSLALNIWPLLSASIIIYVMIRLQVKEEEQYLSEIFGEAYVNYKNNVNLLFPRIIKRK
jgi:protein-S-isoprenylcysteine O-methyltransferase Ste14